jgi:hypothetical protein
MYTKELEPPNLSPGLYRSVVVLWSIAGENGDVNKAATGWAYDSNHIVTAGHFCEGLQKAMAEGMSSEEIGYTISDRQGGIEGEGRAEIKAVSEELDACLLTSPDHGLHPLPVLRDLDLVETGDPITVIGAPRAYFPIQRKGTVVNLSAYQYGPLEKHYMLLAVQIEKGNSGSPVLWNGYVMGMVDLLPNRPKVAALALRGDHLTKFIEDSLLE